MRSIFVYNLPSLTLGLLSWGLGIAAVLLLIVTEILNGIALLRGRAVGK